MVTNENIIYQEAGLNKGIHETSADLNTIDIGAIVADASGFPTATDICVNWEGTLIAWTAVVGSNIDIYVADIATGTKHLVTSYSTTDYVSSAFNQQTNGRQIHFDRTTGDIIIRLVRVDTSEEGEIKPWEIHRIIINETDFDLVDDVIVYQESGDITNAGGLQVDSNGFIYYGNGYQVTWPVPHSTGITVTIFGVFMLLPPTGDATAYTTRELFNNSADGPVIDETYSEPPSDTLTFAVSDAGYFYVKKAEAGKSSVLVRYEYVGGTGPLGSPTTMCTDLLNGTSYQNMVGGHDTATDSAGTLFLSPTQTEVAFSTGETFVNASRIIVWTIPSSTESVLVGEYPPGTQSVFQYNSPWCWQGTCPVPTVATPPTISESSPVTRGTTLHGEPGTWVDGDVSITLQWQRSTTPDGPWENIDGATGFDYTTQCEDSGNYVLLQMQGTTSCGSVGYSDSNQINVIGSPPVLNEGGATITTSDSDGTSIKCGDTLTAHISGITPDDVVYSYQWQRENVPPVTIPPTTPTQTPVGTNDNRYTLTAADLKSKISVIITATNCDGNISTTSAETAAVGDGPPTAGKPLINPDTSIKVGDTLTATPGNWISCSTKPLTYTYEWYSYAADGTDQTTHTKVTNHDDEILVVDADGGRYFRVKVTSDSVVAWSDPTGIVGGVAPKVLKAPTLDGSDKTESETAPYKYLTVKGGKFDYGGSHPIDPNGATWIVGDVAPTNAQGKVGDYYFDEKANNVYVKIAGPPASWKTTTVGEYAFYRCNPDGTGTPELVQNFSEQNTYRLTCADVGYRFKAVQRARNGNGQVDADCVQTTTGTSATSKFFPVLYPKANANFDASPIAGTPPHIVSTNAVQTITITSPGAQHPVGSVILYLLDDKNGNHTPGNATGPVKWNATATQLEAQLNALEGVKPAGVTVTGSGTSGDPWIVTFVNQLADVPVTKITYDRTHLTTGTISVTTTSHALNPEVITDYVDPATGNIDNNKIDEGHTITLDPPTGYGSWDGSCADEFTYSLQWFWDDGSGSNFSPRPGYTGNTYVTSPADITLDSSGKEVGKSIYCQVTVSVPSGVKNIPAATAKSNTVVVQPGPVLDTGAAIVGTLQDDMSVCSPPYNYLSVNTGTITGTAPTDGVYAFSYEWYWNDSPTPPQVIDTTTGKLIADKTHLLNTQGRTGTDSTLVLSADEYGDWIFCFLTISNPQLPSTDDYTVILMSEGGDWPGATGQVIAQPPTNCALPILDSYEVQVGQALGLMLPGSFSGTNLPLPTYQWQENSGEDGAWENIEGATDNSYIIASTDLNYSIRCAVTEDNSSLNGGGVLTVYTTGTDAVTPFVPIVSYPNQQRWLYEAVYGGGENAGELMCVIKNATSKSVAPVRNGLDNANITLSQFTPEAQAIVTSLENDGTPFLRVWSINDEGTDMVCRFYGPLTGIKEDVDTEKRTATVEFKFTAPQFILQNRFVADSTVITGDYSQVVGTLIDSQNDISETHIRTNAGVLTGTTLTFKSDRSDVWTCIQSMVGGFEIKTVYITDAWPKVCDIFLVANGSLGSDRPQVKFQVQEPSSLSNILKFSRTSTWANNQVTMHASNGNSITVSDEDSIAMYGLFEVDMTAPTNIIDDPTLTALATAALTKKAMRVITIEPAATPGTLPQPFNSFNLGDTVYITATIGTLDVGPDVGIEVNGFSISLDANEKQTLSLTLDMGTILG